MKQTLRIVIAITIGLATLLIGQLGIEVVVALWSGGTTSLDTPVLNAAKFAVAGAAALIVGAHIATSGIRRRRLV